LVEIIRNQHISVKRRAPHDRSDKQRDHLTLEALLGSQLAVSKTAETFL